MRTADYLFFIMCAEKLNSVDRIIELFLRGKGEFSALSKIYDTPKSHEAKSRQTQEEGRINK
uniref:Uncharacterized protein n=1 Tax=viral metagenome TaxID=1070528 RepID=A0A6H1ZEE7_9ZZZZ